MFVTVSSFSSPFDVQDAVIVCLAAAWTAEEWDALRIHTGEAGTGEPLSCCPHGLLRVETGSLIPGDELGRRWLGRPNGCVDLVQTIIVTWRQCYQSQTSQGKTKKDVDIVSMGRDLEFRRWRAIEALACCSEYQLRLVASTPDPIEACAGFTISLDATIRVCSNVCVAASGTIQVVPPVVIPSHSIAIGVAGDSSGT